MRLSPFNILRRQEPSAAAIVNPPRHCPEFYASDSPMGTRTRLIHRANLIKKDLQIER